MNFNKARMVYGASGFHFIDGKIRLNVYLSQFILEAYEETVREFSLTPDELYEVVDMITKTIHRDDKSTFAQDFEYTFNDERASFVLMQMKKHLLHKGSIASMIKWVMEFVR